MNDFDIKSLISNTLIAFVAQGVALIASFLTSLIVPKFISVENFAYWQLFIFYSSYVGFFALGALDGVYLINGGKPRSEINKSNITSQFWFSTFYVLLFSTLAAIGLCSFTSDLSRQSVLLLVALYSVASQMSAGLGFILQAMNETKTYSISTIVDRLSFVVFLTFLLLLKCDDFIPYVLFYIFSKFICFFYCGWHLKEFFVKKLLPLKQAAKLTLESIKVGINLMFASIASMLVTGVARLSIDFAWGIIAFSKVSFALSLVGFFSSFVNQASMVLFPALRQGDKSIQFLLYKEMRNFLELISPFIYILYFPISFLLLVWLPQYTESFLYFSYLLPICVYDAKMNICGVTYFKVLRLEKKLLKINLFTVIASAFLTLFSVLLLNSLNAVLFSMVACIVVRSLYSELYLNKIAHALPTSLLLSELGYSIVFILLNLVVKPAQATLIYALLVAIYALIQKRNIVETTKKLKKMVLN